MTTQIITKERAAEIGLKVMDWLEAEGLSGPDSLKVLMLTAAAGTSAAEIPVGKAALMFTLARALIDRNATIN